MWLASFGGWTIPYVPQEERKESKSCLTARKKGQFGILQ